MDEKKQTSDKKKGKDSITVKANKKGRHVMKFMNFLRIFIIPIVRIIKPFRFYGNHKVKDGACVYILNHYALLDPMYPVTTTWEGIHFLAKKENFETPVVGWVARKTKTILVNRDGNDVRALLDCFKCLKNNEKIAIYPEGTRNKTEEPLLPFKHGAAAIAVRAKVPVIPIMSYKKPRFFKMTHILIGDPFELSEYYDRKLTEEELIEADEKLRQVMLDLRNKHTQYLEDKKRGKKA